MSPAQKFFEEFRAKHGPAVDVSAFNRDLILEIARFDPIVHRAMTVHRHTPTSYQNALEMMVVALADQNQMLVRKVQDLAVHAPIMPHTWEEP